VYVPCTRADVDGLDEHAEGRNQSGEREHQEEQLSEPISMCVFVLEGVEEESQEADEECAEQREYGHEEHFRISSSISEAVRRSASSLEPFRRSKFVLLRGKRRCVDASPRWRNAVPVS
jgi:hypothetical protein